MKVLFSGAGAVGHAIGPRLLLEACRRVQQVLGAVLVRFGPVINFEVRWIRNAGEHRGSCGAVDLQIGHVSVVDKQKDADEVPSRVSTACTHGDAFEHLCRWELLIGIEPERGTPAITRRAPGAHGFRLTDKFVSAGKRFGQQELNELSFSIG